MIITRRGLLGTMAAIVVSPAAFVSARVQALEKTVSGEAQDPFLTWCRALNTLQSRYAAGNDKKYADFEDLRRRIPALSNKVTDYPSLPKGTRTWFELSGDGTTYRAAVWDSVSQVVWRTDEKGVIHKGSTPVSDLAVVDKIVFEIPTEPLRKSTTAAPTRAGVLGYLDRVSDFFFPTLSAQCNCFCGSCVGPGPCHLVCGSSQGCCDLGFADCTWCCPNTCCCV